LQRIDTQLNSITTRVKEIDRLLLEDERLLAARASADNSRIHLEKTRLSLRGLEHNVSEQQLKIEQTNSTLYSGNVKNPKELQDLQKDILSLRKYLQVLEDQQLQAMIDFEDAEQANQNAQENSIRVQAEVIQSKAGLAGERDQLIAKKDSLTTERNAALTAITPGNLVIYDHLRELKGGIAVTNVEDETCMLCGAPIRLAEGQMARMQSNLVYCSSCGRIIFAG
jgi:predicted  nucleic acid-binding Zn-ribbon protein